MAVHVPLSVEAQAEARFLMLAANNILKPQDGRPVVSPTQDMVIGSYYLTLEKDGAKGSGTVFASPEEAVLAYNTNNVDLQAPVRVRVTREVDGEMKTGDCLDHARPHHLQPGHSAESWVHGPLCAGK